MRENCENLISYQDEIMDEVLSEYFTLKKCEKAHIWYGEWENHRRNEYRDGAIPQKVMEKLEAVNELT